jgi:hypothetical protein
MRRPNEARPSKKRATVGSSQISSRWETKPVTKRRSGGPSPRVW